MAQSLEEIIERIIQETGFSKKEVLDGIEKIKKDFSGLITDEGAAHIFAKNCGVDMFTEPLPPHKMRIQDLIAGMNNVTIDVKIQQISNITEFSRKSGDSGAVARVMISDETGDVTNLVLWDKQTQLISDKQINVGDIIQINTAYTRLNRRDQVEIHLGKRGKIQPLEDADPEEFPDPKVDKGLVGVRREGPLPIKEITMNSSFITVEGFVKRIFPLREFQRKDGTEGKVRNLILADNSGSMRVTFWNEQAQETIPLKLAPGDKIRLSQMNPRENQYYTQNLSDEELDGTKPASSFQTPLELHSNRTSEIKKIAPATSTLEEGAPPTLPSALHPAMFNISVLGSVANSPKETAFQRKDGTPGSLLYFRITDPNRPAGQYGTPVKIWNVTSESLKDLKMGDTLLITFAETRLGQNDRVEIHNTEMSSYQINPDSVPLPPPAAPEVVEGKFPLVTIRTLQPNTTGRIRASIDAFNLLDPIYPACPECKRKLTQDPATEKWMCATCDKPQTPRPTLILRVVINDGYDEATTSIFGETAEHLLETTARKIQNALKKEKVNSAWDTSLLKKRMQAIQGEEYILTVRKRVRPETGETQLVVTDAQRIDPVEQARLLLEQLEERI